MAKSNPVLSGIKMDEEDSSVDSGIFTKKATYLSITIKTLLLLFTAVVGAFLLFFIVFETGSMELGIGLLIGAVVLTIISSIVGNLSVTLSMPCSFIFALSEGALLGVISFLFEALYPGVAISAVVLTGIVFFISLILFATKRVRVTTSFVRAISTIGISLILFYIVVGISSIFTDTLSSLFFGATSFIALLLSIVLVVYGACMLMIDFQRAQTLVDQEAPKKYEWRICLGLSVSILYIYLKILELLVRLAAITGKNN